MTKIIIVGSRGRMGQALLACAARFPQITVVGQIDQGDDLSAVIDAGEVVVDFSVHTATPAIADLCAARRQALVIGTTGHSAEEGEHLRALQPRLPIVWSANYSTGVNALFWLTRKAAEILGPGFDLEIVEMHHRHKQDAPSGTANTLAQILAEARGVPFPAAVRHGRQGQTGARTPTEIGVHSLRGGDVVGDHTVVFAGDGERIELSHKAGSRETFANGALRAALWAVGQPPGLYDMRHVLGLV